MKKLLMILCAGLVAAAQVFGAAQSVTVSNNNGAATFNTAGVTSYTIGQPVTFTGGTTFNPLPIQASITTIALLRSYTITSAIVNGSAVQVTGYYAPNDGGGGVYVWNSTSTATDNGGTIIQPTGVAIGRWLLQWSNLISVKQFGAYGDGASASPHDDTAAINATCSACGNAGGGVVIFPTATYKITRSVVGTQTPSVIAPAGVSLEGMGSTLLLQDNCGFITNTPGQPSVANITADVAASAVTLSVDSTSGLTVGDLVMVRIGNNAYDSAETSCTYWAKVLSQTSNSVTLDTPAPQAMTYASTAANNRVIFDYNSSTNPVYQNQFIRNFRLVQGASGNSEEGISLYQAINISIDNIYAENPGAGVVLLSYCWNCRVSNIYCPVSIAQAGQTSKGRILNYVGCKSIRTDSVYGANFQGQFSFVESYCKDMHFKNITAINNWTTANASAKVSNDIFDTVQYSQAEYDNIYLGGVGTSAVVFGDGGTVSTITYKNATIDTPSKVTDLTLKSWSGGYLVISYDNLNLNFSQKKTVIYTIPYQSSWSAVNPPFQPPAGLIISIGYYTNSPTGLSTAYIQNSTTGGNVSIALSGITANTKYINYYDYGTNYPWNVPTPNYYALYSGTVNPGTFVTFEYTYIPYVVNDASGPIDSGIYWKTAAHMVSVGSTPTFSSGTGAGTSPTITVTGTDFSGSISVTTGTTPAATAAVLTVNFATAYKAAPNVVLTPTNANAAGVNNSIYVSAQTTGNYTVSTVSALTAATTYTWNYHVVQ